jgi:hypothetical protein
MKQRLFAALTSATLVALTACASPQPTDYAQEKPTLDLQTYFNGNLTAHGIFTDRSGKVVKRFKVLLQCQWSGNEGVLDEDFTYSDGQKQRRVWRLSKQPNGNYIGRADDVVGEAKGVVSGNALQWRYTLRLPVEGRNIDVQFNDWMFLMDERVMINKATMSKFGVRLGEVTLSFYKP